MSTDTQPQPTTGNVTAAKPMDTFRDAFTQYTDIGDQLAEADKDVAKQEGLLEQARSRRNALRERLPELCRALGGDPAELLKGTGIAWTGRTRTARPAAAPASQAQGGK